MSEINVSACNSPHPERCVQISDVQCWLSCALCGGYLIDATTISKCLHTCELFTRSYFSNQISNFSWSRSSQIAVAEIFIRSDCVSLAVQTEVKAFNSCCSRSNNSISISGYGNIS